MKQGYVDVVRSVWKGAKQTVKTPTGVRSFAISTDLQARLGSMREESGHVFHSKNGTPWIANDIQKRHLVPLLKRLGLPQAGFHAFRHGNETIQDRLSTPVALRLARLGRADTRMMINYSHVVSVDDRQLAAELGRMLAPTSPAVLELFGSGGGFETPHRFNDSRNTCFTALFDVTEYLKCRICRKSSRRF